MNFQTLKLDYIRGCEDLYPKPLVFMDEAGCGPWAGPLVVGAVSLKDPFSFEDITIRIDDSKKMSELQREKAYDFIINHENISVGIGIVDSEELDQLGLAKAISVAFNKAYGALEFESKAAFVDGIRDPKINCDTYLIKGGDRLCFGISMASIIAKVTRDRMMHDLHKLYPMYKWNDNKGYGTKDHILSLRQFGVCPIHRKSYKPIQKMLTAGDKIF